MKKPVLVIMAAGMGSRYGGLKQIDPIDEKGHIIIDYSIYDAKRAGFETVIFVIKRENEESFKEVIGRRIEKIMKVLYVYQDLSNIPSPYIVPEQRVKPWGTAHAIWCCKEVIDSPFAVINADDYYGVEAYKQMFAFLSTIQDDTQYHFAMMGYYIENTITENGYVARGICQVDENKQLLDIQERTRIEKTETCASYSEDDGKTWIPLPKGTIVSMNMWGYSKGILAEIEANLPTFLEVELQNNPLTCEFFLPSIVSTLLKENRATVSVLESKDRWYGVTYKEDKPFVVKAIKRMKETGTYPNDLWGNEYE